MLHEEGHNVVLVGNLYDYQDKRDEPQYTNEQQGYSKVSVESLKSGGAYGHLLPVHQTYFKSINHIVREHKRCKRRGAKGVIFFKDNEKALINQDHQRHQGKHRRHRKPVITNTFGQDPLERDAWYVNHIGPHSLIFALDVILPTYYDNMTPDLIIMGPTEDTTTEESVIDAIQYVKQRELKDTKPPTILTVTTFEDSKIYFQDETYFNLQAETYQGSIKSNMVTKTMHFVNKKIVELLNFEQFGTQDSVITVKFPSLNLEHTSCSTDEDYINFKKQYTSVNAEKTFKKLDSERLPIFKFNTLNDIRINLNAWKMIQSARESWNQVINSKQDDEDLKVGSNCKISVNYMNFE
ncbi:uncharacterized protein KQ657_003236 [Scheffersomyces spartinae]|uniref:Uncharacterized protein n=1 Tax=Scheffersomyces spartinae TaxID=45513 RepID=A0A9P7VDF6_9ASCO|nr:uncharacterized protein KQ657_003236 [Scheffersomyces spartinae]KAG7195473.1 hypothetical protein KQ657_003236 [Scheffersomyces spartinae]